MNRKTFLPVELKLSETGSIEAAFAQLNVVDHDGDVTFPGTFPTKDVPMSAYNHTSWDGALPVGKGSIAERGDWAVFTGQFFMQTTQGRDAYETVKALGPLAQYSYGYQVLDGGPVTHEGKAANAIRKLDVFEVSPVLMGAGIGTHTLAIKSGGPGTDLPYAEHLSWLRDEVTAFADRTKARVEMREQDGRKLSRSDRETLAALLEELAPFSGIADQLAALIAEPEPNKRATSLALEIARARSLGIV